MGVLRDPNQLRKANVERTAQPVSGVQRECPHVTLHQPDRRAVHPRALSDLFKREPKLLAPMGELVGYRPAERRHGADSRKAVPRRPRDYSLVWPRTDRRSMMTRRSPGTEPDITQAVRDELSLLLPAQVAELLGVTINWLYDRIEAGDIAVVRLGRRTLRLRPDDVKAFIDANRSQTSTREARIASRGAVQPEAPARPRRGRPRNP